MNSSSLPVSINHVMKVVSIFLFAAIYQVNGLNKAHWDKEIERSLKSGMVKCNYRIRTDTTQKVSNEDFLVKVLYPTEHDMKVIKMLPVALTKANKVIAETSVKRGYNYEKWGAEDISRWEIPKNHPGQDRKNCINMTNLSGNEQVISYYESYHTIERAFYSIHIKEAFIHTSGVVAGRCGYFYGGEDGCEPRWDYAKDWFFPCTRSLQQHNQSWEIFFNKSTEVQTTLIPKILDGCKHLIDLGSKNLKDFPVTHHKKVFTLAALWDYNYHHFVADSLARITHHLRYLKNNPDVMIHVREFEDYDMARKNNKEFKRTSELMRNRLFELLGINKNRLISGAVLAEEAIFPRYLRCAYSASNPAEIRLLAKQLITASYHYLLNNQNTLANTVFKDPKSPFYQFKLLKSTKRYDALTKTTDVITTPSPVTTNDGKKKTLIVQQRYSSFTTSDRGWTNETAKEVAKAFQDQFPEHHVVIINSYSPTIDPKYCLACEILLYSQADILVGAHGAGLTNLMFLPVNSLVFEIVGVMKDVNMPVCGYYGPMGASLGHHHYLYGYDDEAKQPINPKQGAKEARSFYQYLQNRKNPHDTKGILTLYNTRGKMTE